MDGGQFRAPDAEAIDETNRMRRGRRRPKGSDGGENFPPVPVRKGDREAGSAALSFTSDAFIISNDNDDDDDDDDNTIANAERVGADCVVSS
jgi:hypothetical protein